MTEQEYTPTVQEVRNHYLALDQDRAEFDRMIAAVRADAWDEGNRAHPKFGINPYR